MVAYTDSLGFYKNSVGFTSNYTMRNTVVDIDIDFRKIAAARTAAGAAALAATDTLVIGVLPKGSYVVAAAVTVVRPEGATCTIDLGVSGSTTLFASSLDINTAAGTTAGVTNGARYQPANTDILLTIDSAATDNARVKISLALIDMGAELGVVPSA
jgi:hypothetical protein